MGINLGNMIGKVVGGSASEIVKNVGSVIDEFKLSPEEKLQFEEKLTAELNRHNEELINASNDLEKAYLEDVSSSRDMNAKIQESEKASWLAKNVGYLLDIVFVVAFFIGLLMIMYKAVPSENKELFYTGFGLLGGYVSTILGYHRGSSSGSKANAEALRHIVKNK